ncbi:unnamed protein product, partial [Symbiodinium necroappetens]
PVLSCDTVKTIAERCGRSPAQVCLRWNLEKGNAIVFKSLTPSRIEENAWDLEVDVFDFSLGSDEVAALDTVTTHKVRAEAQSHWHLRRSGTDAPRGPGLRPEKRTVQEASGRVCAGCSHTRCMPVCGGHISASQSSRFQFASHVPIRTFFFRSSRASASP